MNKRNNIAALILLGVMILAACGSSATVTTSSGNNTTSSHPFDGAKLNLNSVSGDELLVTIPDFPNRMVREFQEYRPYISIQQFRREIGKYVSDDQVALYEQYVYIPISFNSSDAETLGQIPGLNTSEADAIIAARPFATPDNFLSKLGEYVSTDQLETAKSYLGES